MWIFFSPERLCFNNEICVFEQWKTYFLNVSNKYSKFLSYKCVFFTRHTFLVWRTFFFCVTFQTIICKQTSVMNHLLFSLFSSTRYLWQGSSLQSFLLEVASNFFPNERHFFLSFKNKKIKSRVSGKGLTEQWNASTNSKDRIKWDTGQDTICGSNI